MSLRFAKDGKDVFGLDYSVSNDLTMTPKRYRLNDVF